ncbi:unnamed protein product [Orchesella dallaii]|uniref:Uncharacterized protein n=1 Tax=Orchesella dallaii TaxID=48710 RepID=A0ABP1Q9Q0_9HEXA
MPVQVKSQSPVQVDKRQQYSQQLLCLLKAGLEVVGSKTSSSKSVSTQASKVSGWHSASTSARSFYKETRRKYLCIKTQSVSSTLEPTQSSNKKGSEDPHRSYQDGEKDLLNELATKRTRVMGSTIDREVEARGQQESNNDEEEEHKAYQGPFAGDAAQVQHSDKTTKESKLRQGRRGNDGHDSDSNVIIIDSDDDDEVGYATSVSSGK